MFTMYSMNNCEWCTKAKTLLLELGFNFVELKVGNDEAISFATFKNNFPEFETLPQLFHDGKHVGGYTELAEYVKTIWPAK